MGQGGVRAVGAAWSGPAHANGAPPSMSRRGPILASLRWAAGYPAPWRFATAA